MLCYFSVQVFLLAVQWELSSGNVNRDICLGVPSLRGKSRLSEVSLGKHWALRDT